MADTKLFLGNDSGIPIPGVGLLKTTEDDALFLDNIREIANLSMMRKEYNTIIHCRNGRILVEVGGNQQIKVRPGQLLLIPAGKVVQPIMVSTDVDAGVLLVSDKTLKTVLAGQINIWNKAMYMKEIYVVEEAGWVEGIESYARSLFKATTPPVLFREMMTSFLRTMLLMICEGLIQHKEMTSTDDASTTHDKDLFNRFLQLLALQEQKRQQVSFYADKLNLTPKYLSKIIKEASGRSGPEWIDDFVILEAKNLLRYSNMSIKEVVFALNFPNPSVFHKYFKAHTGQTPTEYRKGF